jgi:energy-converting hydrogenase A subunit R
MEPNRHRLQTAHRQMYPSHEAAEAQLVKRVFVSDCEGPISKNDNAYEATARFVPKGDKLFTRISKYDDVLADVVKKPGYNAGDTLKLILPFLKAYDVNDEQLKQFSAENLLLISGSKNTLEHVRRSSDSFIVSTSYEHYIRALCDELSFPFEKTYCTRMSLDKYVVSSRENSQLREFATEIAQMPIITIPPNAKSLEDFSEQDRETVMQLDSIFWEKISRMGAGIVFRITKPVGGRQKAEAVKNAVDRSGVQLSDVLYVGDSITDVEAFKLVTENGGLTVSFNGNEYAVRNAELAVLSENNTIVAVIADLFSKKEKEKVLQVLGECSYENLKQTSVAKSILEKLSVKLPKLQIVTPKNMETLVRESIDFRKKIRGEAVGRLG